MCLLVHWRHSPRSTENEKQVNCDYKTTSSSDFSIDAYTFTAQSTSLEPWFGPHVQRNIYLSLLHIEPQPGQEKATPVPDSVLKTALLQRATEDIRRILAIRVAKQPLHQLLQKGSVGDELWQRFLRAEKEMEAELRDVVEEV